MASSDDALRKAKAAIISQHLAAMSAFTGSLANTAKLSLGGPPTKPITPGGGSSIPSGIVKKPKNKKLKAGDVIKIIRGEYAGSERIIGCVHGDVFFLTRESADRGGYECSTHRTMYKIGGDGLPHLHNGEKTWEPVKSKKANKEKLAEAQLSRLVLPEEDVRLIRAVLQQRENHSKIFNQWGLGETVEYGKGMGFLFHGLPGTGKTFAALCIARSIGQELHAIGPAEIQSQEPGGANRAIQEAFRIATKEKKVLLLDECDSLIGNRMNLGMILAGEVNTLLTEIEKFEGIVVLATNRITHLDPALERRLSLILEFKVPDAQNRVRIWKGIIPKKMPVKGVTVEELAQYPLTGGQIKNVLLGAARIAASTKSRGVTKEHFEQAVGMVLKSKNLMGTADRRPRARYSPTNH